jgi:excisionase family DNA binding protein
MDFVVNSNSDIFTVKEVSEYLRIHPSTVYRMLSKKQLPGFRVGADWRFSVKAIEQWRLHAEAVTAEGAILSKPGAH